MELGTGPGSASANPRSFFRFPSSGAHDRIRTGDPVLTKNVLYQLSYVGFLRTVWWRGQDSNLRSPSGRRVYSPVVLTAHPPRPGTQYMEPKGGVEPPT